jgi:hypothetical protein
MADANSNTTCNAVIEQQNNPSDKAYIKLDRLHGLLDCLYTIAVTNTNINQSGLSHNSIVTTLELAIDQVNEAQDLLCEVAA